MHQMCKVRHNKHTKATHCELLIYSVVVTAAVAAGLVGAATPPEMIKELLAQRVEEDGKNLSGGIGKAIAFARIFVKPTADLGTARLF